MSATFRVDPFTDAIELMLGFNPEELGAGQVQTWGEYYLRALETMVEVPDTGHDAFMPCSQESCLQVYAQLNDNAQTYRHQACVHHLFSEWSARDPEAPAVIEEAEVITRGQLEARSNRLARFLSDRGVGDESRVVLYLENGLDFVVSLLAVAKTGGAYVPVEPSFPLARVREILEDVRPAVVITPSHFPDLDLTHQWSIVALERDRAEIQAYPRTALENKVDPANLLYIIYTSGSTGKPKGVCITHRAMVHFLHGYADFLKIQPDHTQAALTTVAADLGYATLFSALCGGYPYVVIPRASLLEGNSFGQALAAHPVHCYKTVPTHLQLLFLADQPDKVLPEEILMLAGEQLDSRLVARVAALNPNLRLINFYGPTETTVSILGHEVDTSQLPAAVEPIPIGRPMVNGRAYLCDAGLNLVPPMSQGELLLGSGRLARCYWGRPAATAEKFVPDPFSGETGSRLYKSGDRVRLLPDGCIEFCGRIDDQVKIRGFRVEPKEAQALLSDHPQVEDALVLARGDGPAGLQLVAYLCTKTNSRELAPELRALLERHLPDYMIPTAYVYLDALPLNANGKVDRHRLPDPDQGQPPPNKDDALPQTPGETLVADIWADILKMKRVGLRDRFFDLGGHSIAMALVASRIRDAFAVNLPLRLAFEADTVEKMAATVDRLRSGGARPEEEIPAVPRSGRLQLSHAQARMWFLDKMAGPSTNYNISGALHFEGDFHRAAFFASLVTIMARHEVLRSTFPEVDGKPTVVIAANAEPDLRIYDLSSLPGDVREPIVLSIEEDNLATHFNLAELPLLRFDLVRLDPRTHLLFVNMPHIISDGWSIGIFTNELTEIYRAYLTNRAPELPQLPIQYVDYAHWQRGWLERGELAHQLVWWKGFLRGLPPLLELPTDRPRPPQVRHHGNTCGFAISHELLEGLKALGRKQNATLFMSTLAAFMVLLYRYSGQGDLAVGSAIAGRGKREAEKLIGLFINTLVLRGRPGAHASFAAFLDELRQDLLDIYDHPDVPFELLVNELQPQRPSGHAPLFQVMFTLRTKNESSLDLPGLRIHTKRQEVGISRFDMILFLRETDHGLAGLVEYRTDLFDHCTIPIMTQHYVHLLESIVADPDLAPSQLTLRPPKSSPGPVSRDQPLPLSLTQQALLHRGVNPVGTDNPMLIIRLTGRLNPVVFSAALGRLAVKYEMLRTGVGIQNDSPFLVIPEQPGLAPTFLDLRGLEPQIRDREWQQVLGRETRLDFDLTRPPLMRILIGRLDTEQWILALHLHCLIADRESTEVIWHELCEAYTAQLNGDDWPMAAPSLQYPDYAWQQRNWLNGDVLRRHLAFWQTELTASPPALSLPVSGVATAQHPMDFDEITHHFNEELLGELRSFNADHQTSLFNTLYGTLVVLLFRYTGQEDFLVSTRTVEYQQTAPLVGPMTNTLALRTQVSPNRGFSHLLQHLEGYLDRIHDFRELPFSKLLQAHDLGSDHPLRQILFQLVRSGANPPSLPQVYWETMPSFPTAGYLFNFVFREGPSSLRGTLTFWNPQLNAATMNRFLEDYIALLEQIVRHPDQPLLDLSLSAMDQAETMTSELEKLPEDFLF